MQKSAFHLNPGDGSEAMLLTRRSVLYALKEALVWYTDSCSETSVTVNEALWLSLYQRASMSLTTVHHEYLLATLLMTKPC